MQPKYGNWSHILFVNNMFSYIQRCCADTLQIQSKEITTNHSETNVMKHELITCPNNLNLSSSLSIQTNVTGNEDDPKVCEYGTYKDYRLQHGDTKLVSVDSEEETVNINRTWLGLPNLQIPIQSASYCVRKLLIKNDKTYSLKVMTHLPYD